MKKKLLIGDTIDGFGSRMASCFNGMGAVASVCSNRYSEYLSRLKNDHYDCMICTSINTDTEMYPFIRSVRSEFPDMLILAALYEVSDDYCKGLIDAGADNCFRLPYSVTDMCIWICGMLGEDTAELHLPEISRILEKKKFPTDMNGFSYLCTAAEICIRKPDMLESITDKLYSRIADKMNISEKLVERSLRHYSSALFEKGLIPVLFDQEVGQALTNRELIALTCDLLSTALVLY
ncbi:sporulation initiation factor Spo0A C-terminal domain-containing protein [Ruminococcus sp. XPD3002]|uniref:sporulation initiation factor Spo0A C-terminal domain-containing protein n=1 Tax=Ruminococcus sp. XPD3002 TaxID=1452269 RepID=UPI00091A682E|nr:hypothetical protein [Ruminococcus sp.]SFX78124.1 Sporulation initiation factor Spo0A C terminal [Ruminococcus flavefaciens]HPY86215.1 sporulation initiation factor Spo0A C-terminal domain-containing protein [Ruminococcus flavefaciens]HRU96544.1 sporulation initiation factor Spo0A C-terminal domain-containing protein [Ruminococcus sp.]